MTNLSGKTAIVTGASKGIGAAIAKNLAQQGANVIVNYRSDTNGAKQIVKEITQNGDTAIAVQADVSKPTDIQHLFESASNKFGEIDILVNNAGVYQFEPLEMVTEAELQRQFSTNVFSALLTTQTALNYFNTNGGSIVNISSIATVKAMPSTVVYTATKGALDGITTVLSKELADRKIRVNAILPGPTETEGNPIGGTEMGDYIINNTPLGNIGHPTDMAHLVTFLASDNSKWITGQKIAISGGFD